MEEQPELPSKLESDKTKSSKPSLRETIRPAVERVSNDSSGRATEPSKYRTTCLLPHATSSKNAPKANTSELVVALPVLTYSGASLKLHPRTYWVDTVEPVADVKPRDTVSSMSREISWGKDKRGLLGLPTLRGATVTLICLALPSYSTQTCIGLPLPRLKL
nr:hypothetical protein POPTR_T083000 [Ipomoea batatas]